MDAALWLALAGLGAALLAVHARRALFPYQLVPSEGGLLMSVRALEQGWDPWAADKAYAHSNNYGIAWPWLVSLLRPLAPGLPLLVFMRGVSAACALAALALLYSGSRRWGLDARGALALCLAVYAPWIWYDTLTARPDGLVAALFLAVLLLTFKPAAWAAPLAGGLAAAAYFAKPYAVLALPLALLSLALQRRRRDLALALAGAAAAGLGLGAWVLHRSPLYFQGTLLTLSGNTQLSAAHFFGQAGQLLRIHAPLALGLGLGLAQAWRQGRGLAPRGAAALWSALALGSLALLAMGPGAHRGATLRYFHQIFLPLAIPAAALWLAGLGWRPAFLALLLLADAGSMLAYDLATCPPQSREPLAAWRKVDAWIAQRPHGFYPGLFLSQVEARGALVSDTDHNKYIRLILKRGALKEAADAEQARLEAQISRGELEGLLLPSAEPDLAKNRLPGYRPLEFFCLASPVQGFCFTYFVPQKERPRP